VTYIGIWASGIALGVRGGQRDLAGVPPVLGSLRELHAQVERGVAERSLAASAVPSRGSSSPALRALGYVQ